MKNNLITITLLTFLVLTTACGALKKTATPSTSTQNTTVTTPTYDPCDEVITTLGDWSTMQTSGNIKLSGSSSFSSSVQVRMVRDKSIYISLRPVLGIEVGRLVITADSLYAVDKVHKRYIAEKVSILTAGIPVTVSDVQDIFMGRPCVIGQGTLGESNKAKVHAFREDNSIILSPVDQYKGYGYTYAFDKSKRITSLYIVPAGATTTAYQAKYSDVRSTPAGNVAHAVNANANVDSKKIAFSLSYKNIEWNGEVKIDQGIPNGYKRMSAKDLFSLFGE